MVKNIIRKEGGITIYQSLVAVVFQWIAKGRAVNVVLNELIQSCRGKKLETLSQDIFQPLTDEDLSVYFSRRSSEVSKAIASTLRGMPKGAFEMLTDDALREMATNNFKFCKLLAFQQLASEDFIDLISQVNDGSMSLGKATKVRKL